MSDTFTIAAISLLLVVSGGYSIAFSLGHVSYGAAVVNMLLMLIIIVSMGFTALITAD